MLVDVVYAWVDGSDQELANKRAKYKMNKVHNGPVRFQDNEELKHSMRSIAKYAKWVNHIYIITDGQRPEWLSDSEKVTIVDHKDIIPHQFLPTFNSSVIELYVHKIKGLSENYLYFNDDMMLGKPTVISDFFKNGKPFVFVSSILPTNRFPPCNDYGSCHIDNNRKLLLEQLGNYKHYGFRHGVVVMNKTKVNEVFEIYKDHIEQWSKNRFRDYPFSLTHLVFSHAINDGSYVAKYQRKLKKPSVFNRFGCTFHMVNESNLIRNFTNQFNEFTPLVFCINDSEFKMSDLTLFKSGALSKKCEFEK